MEDKKQFNIRKEIMNDALGLSTILDIKRNINSYMHKEILNNFLTFFSSIFCQEVIKSNHGIISGKRKITLENIDDFRNYNLKFCPSITSDNTNRIIKEMEITLDKYTFDIILTFNGNDLIDINTRYWDYDKEEQFELLDGEIATPQRWLEILIPGTYEIIRESLEKYILKVSKDIENMNIQKKEYSVFKLFENSKISDDEKLYIIQRIGLLKNVLFVEYIFKANNLLIDIEELDFGFLRFITKCKAVIIEMFWNDKKSNKNLNILSEIFEKNSKQIPSEFYVINRKCRNNIHYSDYHEISKEELELLIKYQNIYLSNVLEVFNKNLTIKLDFFYKILLSLAKVEYEARNKKNENSN